MRSFAPEFLERHEITHGLASTLRLLGEFRGRQDMYRAQSPELLEGLRRRAMIESVESSTRLEGAAAAPDRVRDIVGGGKPPAQGDRSEQEIAGYRDALATIHEYYPAMPVTPGVILQLHRELFRYLPSAGGAWKMADNSIAENLPDGSRVVLFQPVPAWQTPAAVDELCRGLAESLDRGAVDPLLAVAAFVFDFLCIHPFADGNGRMAAC